MSNPRPRLAVLALGIITVILLTPATALAFPLPPNIFWGPVFIGEQPAPDGLRVVAKLNIKEGNSVRLQTFSTATTFQGNYGTKDRLAIGGDDPDTPEKEGATAGEPIYFFLVTPRGELPAQLEPPTFRVGRTSMVPLHFPAEGIDRPELSQIPDGARLPAGNAVIGKPLAPETSTVRAVISNFTESFQQQPLVLLNGNEVVQRQTVSMPGHAEAIVEFEVPAQDAGSYRVQSIGEPGSVVAADLAASSLVFDNLSITPPQVANSQRVSVGADVNNTGPLPVYRQAFLRVRGEFVGPPHDILVAPGEVQNLDFEYVPQGLKSGPVPVMVGNATGILTIIDPPHPRLYIPLLILGLLVALGAAVWLYRSARRRAAPTAGS